MTRWFVSCARRMASRTMSSGSSRAPASIINTPARVPATTRSSLLSASSAYVGLITKRPSTYPTRVAPIGPSKGMSDIVSAAEAPLIAGMSRGFSMSADSGVMMTWTSLRNPFGKRGRTGLSVRRSMRMASVLGLPSRRKKLPGILPLA